MEKKWICFSIGLLAVFIHGSVEAARFRHPLTVSDMSSFAAPESYGGYGYGLFSGAGTPERYSDVPNRYAYRTKTYYDEPEPEAEELKVLEDPVDVEIPEPSRRSISNYYTRKLRRERELKTLYDKLAKKFPFLVQQGLYSQGKKPSLDHLLGMTIFGQPKMGRK